MNHKLAETQHSVDRYTLNEMSPDERAEFELHMFDCPVCSERIRQNYTIIENMKPVIRESPVEARASWRDWFRIPSLVPTFAALSLAGIVGYQNFAVMPPAMVQIATASLRSESRGDRVYTPVHVDSKASTLDLTVEVDSPSGAFPFRCELDDADGRKTLIGPIDGQKSADVDSVSIRLNRKSVPAGRYTLILRPAPTPDQAISYPFEVIVDGK